MPLASMRCASMPLLGAATRRAFHSSRALAQDHYRVLGVAASASKDEIKKQYYKLAKQYHPDTATGGNTKATTEQFTRIQSAWEVLGDDKARKDYDRESASSASSSAWSSSSYSSPFSSASYAYTGSGPRPDEAEYSFRAWSTRANPNMWGMGGASASGNANASARARAAAGNAFRMEYDDFVPDDLDDDITEEELLRDLFGEGVGGRRRRRSASASASSRTRRSSAKEKRDRERERAKVEEEEEEGDEDAEDDSNSFFTNRTTRAFRAAARARRPIKGSDVNMDVQLSFVEAAQGASKTISFHADSPCKSCKGLGSTQSSAHVCKGCNGRGVQNMRMPGHLAMHVTCERCDGSGVQASTCAPCAGSGVVREKRTLLVTIPPGVDEATSIRIAGQGHAGKRGGAAGHLMLKAQVASHPTFTRDGFDLLVEHSLPLTTAILGGVTLVPTLDGGVTPVRVKGGTQHQSTHVLAGKGIRVLNKPGARAASSTTPGASHGSQRIKWKVEMPPLSSLSPRAKDLLKQLALEMGNIHNIDLTADIKANSAAAEADSPAAADSTASSTASSSSRSSSSRSPSADSTADPDSSSSSSEPRAKPTRAQRRAAREAKAEAREAAEANSTDATAQEVAGASASASDTHAQATAGEPQLADLAARLRKERAALIKEAQQKTRRTARVKVRARPHSTY